VVACLLEARIAESRSCVVLPIAALATIREAISADGSMGRAHEGFVLIARDFVAAHQERLTDRERALRQLIGVAEPVVRASAEEGGAGWNHDHFRAMLAVARNFVLVGGGAPGDGNDQQEQRAIHGLQSYPSSHALVRISDVQNCFLLLGAAAARRFDIRERSTMKTLLLLVALLTPAAFAASDQTKSPADTPESVQAKQELLWGRMEEAIRSVVRETDAVVGVAILDLTDQRSFHLNADAIYPTASTIKIAVLAELYRQHERGSGAKLGDLYTVNAKDGVGTEGILQSMSAGVSRITNHDLALLMVSLSDNSATNVLIDRVGMENVNAWLAQIGLKHTRLRRRMLDVEAAQEGRENTATPRELVTMLRAIHDGRVFNKATTADFIKMLATEKSSYIPRLLPDDLTTATKPGSLDAVRNDAGIILVPGRPFAIAVMTTFAADGLAAEESIGRIAHAAWSYFDRVGKSSSLGRVVR
jgi:beta-lactamase class A